MPSFIQADDDKKWLSTTKLFGRQKSLYDLLGGEKVAYILLWRDYRLSAGILAAFTVVWFLFEVLEYHFITLLCHISITAMLVIFIWCNAVALLEINPPTFEKFNLSVRTKEVALNFHDKLGWFMHSLYETAAGKDLKLFLLTIASLWILSVIGSYCSSLGLLYFGTLCMFSVPALYEKYEGELDQLASRGKRDLKRLYTEFDSKVLDKIPRGPVKEKKLK